MTYPAVAAIVLRAVCTSFGITKDKQVQDLLPALTTLDNVIAPVLPDKTTDRLVRLRDGAVVDDIGLTDGHPAQDMSRRVGQLG